MNASLPTPHADHPDCSQDASQYQQWRTYAIKTRAYQHQMIKQCRCTHAKTRFFVDCDGYTEGRRPFSERLVNCKKKDRR